MIPINLFINRLPQTATLKMVALILSLMVVIPIIEAMRANFYIPKTDDDYEERVKPFEASIRFIENAKSLYFDSIEEEQHTIRDSLHSLKSKP